ncbi:hypothetical protein CDD83_5052 [Cordyceps sp. RAO-2017]|nr:hypothetical protein CDD83_5052 [Cordyceps sp. RAO-2017]
MARLVADEAAELPDLLAHLELLQPEDERESREASEVAGTPVFTASVRQYGRGLSARPFPQFGLLGFDAAKMATAAGRFGGRLAVDDDPRLFHNVATPSSVFICGSQGSGKSHTLGCLLENCLIPSSANVLPKPLTGVVFHYDSFVSNARGAPCEAAYLSSHPAVQVRVLCPPTNIASIRSIYEKLPNVAVEELRFDESDLNTKRMLDLMAISSVQGGGMPLYLHVVTRILRDLRRAEQQQRTTHFHYKAFRDAVAKEDLTPGQLAPLQQRLDTLESFMVEQQVRTATKAGQTAVKAPSGPTQGNDWTPKARQLTIVDLSCPCVTPDAACALFNICLSLFLEQDSEIGRVIALDEAHKYMTDTLECSTLTETLLSTIRLQRHLGTRVFISTQEPTISPKLLDLCSVTMVHRFTSPNWLLSLRKHLAGATTLNPGERGDDDDEAAARPDVALELLDRIVALRTGEALLFAPGAIVAVAGGHARRPGSVSGSSDSSLDSDASLDAVSNLRKLGTRAIKIRVRQRITQDGGRTIMAT